MEGGGGIREVSLYVHRLANITVQDHTCWLIVYKGTSI